MPFRITETAGFIALSLAGRLEACIAACSASVTRLSSCLTCSRKVRSSSCVCAVAAWGRPSAAATASAMVAFLYMLFLQVLAIAMRLRHVVLHVRQCMQLGRLLGKHQRNGDEQMTQSVIHGVARPCSLLQHA